MAKGFKATLHLPSWVKITCIHLCNCHNFIQVRITTTYAYMT